MCLLEATRLCSDFTTNKMIINKQFYLFKLMEAVVLQSLRHTLISFGWLTSCSPLGEDRSVLGCTLEEIDDLSDRMINVK